MGKKLRCFSLQQTDSASSSCRSFATASRSPGHSARTARDKRTASSCSPRSVASAARLRRVGVRDSLIDAAKRLGAAEGQDPPPTGFRLGWLAAVAVDHARQQELGIVRVERQALDTCLQGRRACRRASDGIGRSGRTASG